MRKFYVSISLAAAMLALPAATSAQTFITPFVGATFGADSPGERATGGASILFMGRAAGLELEFGYTPDFFKESDDIEFVSDSNITSLSANLVLGVGAGPVRPYVTGGAGLLRTRITSAEDFFDEISENDFGFNAGGGLMVLFNDHVGLRGDVRYFRSLQDIDAGDLALELGNFDFWRAYAGLSLGF